MHLARDLAGLGLIWWLVSRYLSERSAVWIVSMSALAVGVCLLLFDADVEWYVGISGALFGLYTAGALHMCKERVMLGAALLLGMLGVLAWSLYAGALPLETTGLGGAVIPQAHLYGAIGGALTLVALELSKGLHTVRTADSDEAESP
jgi:membrane associated rhomboid family serine protease